MERNEMIKILTLIKEGRAKIEDMRDPACFTFIEKSKNPTIYEMDGKEYTEQQYQDFCNKVAERNRNAIFWNETKTYLKEDVVIKLVYGLRDISI